MLVLALDTAMTRCSVAIGDGQAIAAHLCQEMERGHAEALVPMVAMACEAAGVALSDIDRVALTVGPGSFTGVRLGVAAARGLALALACPLVGVNCLEAVAAGYLAAPAAGESCVVVQDARRGEVYWQRFAGLTAQGWPRAAAAPERLAAAQAMARLAAGGDCVIGTAADQFATLAPARRPAHDPLPDARVLVRLGAAGMARDGDSLLPFYLRPPDARRPAGTPLAPLAPPS